MFLAARLLKEETTHRAHFSDVLFLGPNLGHGCREGGLWTRGRKHWGDRGAVQLSPRSLWELSSGSHQKDVSIHCPGSGRTLIPGDWGRGPGEMNHLNILGKEVVPGRSAGVPAGVGTCRGRGRPECRVLARLMN